MTEPTTEPATTEPMGRRRRIVGDDAGVTLPELMMAMAIFTVIVAISMSAMSTMAGNTVRVTGTADARVEADRVYNRLDKIVPYAAAITSQGQVGDSWYVEVRTDVPAGTAAGPACWQLRLDTRSGLLQMRTWAPGTTPATTPPWTTLATQARARADAGGSPPLHFLRAGVAADGSVASFDRQRLRLALDVGVVGGPAYPLDATFVARNTSANTATNNGGLTCQEVART